MEIILLEKIQNLGNLGDQVTVKPGFGRNFLIPSGKAVPATKENVEKFEAQRAELEKAMADQLSNAQSRAEKINELQISITHKAGNEGKLFGSVTGQEIAETATNAGVEIHKSEVQLPEGPFRMVGDYEVSINLHADVNATLKVSVVPEEE